MLAWETRRLGDGGWESPDVGPIVDILVADGSPAGRRATEDFLSHSALLRAQVDEWPADAEALLVAVMAPEGRPAAPPGPAADDDPGADIEPAFRGAIAFTPVQTLRDALRQISREALTGWRIRARTAAVAPGLSPAVAAALDDMEDFPSAPEDVDLPPGSVGVAVFLSGVPSFVWSTVPADRIDDVSSAARSRAVPAPRDGAEDPHCGPMDRAADEAVRAALRREASRALEAGGRADGADVFGLAVASSFDDPRFSRDIRCLVSHALREGFEPWVTVSIAPSGRVSSSVCSLVDASSGVTPQDLVDGVGAALGVGATPGAAAERIARNSRALH